MDNLNMEYMKQNMETIIIKEIVIFSVKGFDFPTPFFVGEGLV